jgi:peptidoglycan/LPS O-acetylase OafA/YrhL
LTYRPHLDGIRAIAVIAVVLFHAGVPGFSGGFVGVDVFFVISGYLITGLLLKEFEDTGDISIRRFVERRIRRLGPALFVVLLATIIAGMALLSPIGGEQQGLAKSAMAAVLLVANHYFQLHSGSYFDPPPYSMPLLHTWSLSVEEQFYLVWPWLLLAIGLLARKRGIGVARAAAPLLAALATASFLACVWLTPGNQQAAFYLTPFRAWEFAIGALGFLAVRARPAGGALADAVAIAGFAAIAASIAFYSEAMSFPGSLAALPVLGACALICGSEANRDGIAAKALSWRPLVWIGLLSYSLYLWHWPVYTFARTLLLGDFGVWQGLLLSLLSLLLAWLTWRYVEQPIRSRDWPLMSTRGRTYGVGAAFAATVLMAAIGVGAWAKLVWPGLPGNAELATRIDAIRRPDWNCEAGMQVHSASGVERGCSTGPSRLATILFWGDSHAGQLKDALASVARQERTTGLLRYRPQCPPAIGFHRLRPAQEIEACAKFNDDVLADVLSRPQLHTVVLAARWVAYATDVDADGELQLALQRTTARLQQRGIRVVMVTPGVEFPWPVPACIVRRGEAACGRSRAEAEARRAEALALLHSLVRANPGIELLDPMTLFCGEGRCPVSRNGHVLYSDAHHLSREGAEALVPAFVLATRLATSPRAAAGASR